ncbi:MAG: metal-dependent transcriptional regulator [candidate division Zixibacteria bacterium]|nr:metal-dependent transcriptional regulator [candidate division Zixibacteria bacterium]
MWWIASFGLVLLTFWPRRGIYARWSRRRRLRSRQVIEDALTHLHRQHLEGRPVSVEMLAHVLGLATKDALTLVNRLSAQGLATMTGEGLRLTPEGHRWALQVIRAHRLFERYLADETSVPMEEIHTRADRLEHTVTVAELNRMDAQLGHPAFDPQGDPIPNSDGEMQTVESHSLVGWPVGTLAEIVHIEDEPPEVYAQIVAEGLRVGMAVVVLESSSTRIMVETDTAEHVLAPVIAANVAVRHSTNAISSPRQGIRLTELAKNCESRILGLDPVCQGLTRRRFLDLGLTPGAGIERVMQSAFGEPVAYRIRGTLIALRKEQSDMIWITE